MSTRSKINQMKSHSREPSDNHDELMAVPKDYRGLPDNASDDYDLAAKINLRMQERQDLKERINGHIDSEDLYVYGPASSYKSKYRYNCDD